MDRQKVDLLLLRATLGDVSLGSLEVATELKNVYKHIFQSVAVSFNEQTNEFYVYFYLNDPLSCPELDLHLLPKRILNALNNIECHRILFKNVIAGFSNKETPVNRYVVEMDPELGWEQELFDWYDKEHLPGLAAVPGCINASRCINLDAKPYSFAFYDLCSTDVLGCDAWLKVRHTAWSDKVRPHFTNTKRTMFVLI